MEGKKKKKKKLHFWPNTSKVLSNKRKKEDTDEYILYVE